MSEAHTPECMSAWLDFDAPCICGAITYPPPTNLVEKSPDQDESKLPPATLMDPGGIPALDRLGHDGPSAPDGPQQHGLARRTERAIGPSGRGHIHTVPGSVPPIAKGQLPLLSDDWDEQHQ